MIGLIRPRIRERRRRVEGSVGRWLLLSAVWCGAAHAAPPPNDTPPNDTPPPAAAPGTPDDELIEFLGSDDVGDADWWEFLKKVPQRGENAPAPPPQEAKQ
jgi:hypothetical protein